MHYFFIEEKEGEIIFSSSDKHHIAKVLRKKIDSILYCISENDFLIEVKIRSINPFSVEIISKNKIDNINDSNIHMFLGVIKKPNFELVIKSLNEINIKSLTPVLFERSQRNINYDEDRIKNILRESSKQSNRIKPIIVNKIINYSEFSNLIKDKINYFANEKEKLNSFTKLNCKIKSDINLIVGPEGGFTPNEINDIYKVSNSISLGVNILRSETAAIYMASIFIEKENENEK